MSIRLHLYFYICMLHMQGSNLRPQSYDPCALPATPMCSVVVTGGFEPSTSMVSAWCSTVELCHSMCHRCMGATIRALPDFVRKHHLNALTGKISDVLIWVHIYIITFLVECFMRILRASNPSDFLERQSSGHAKQPQYPKHNRGHRWARSIDLSINPPRRTLPTELCVRIVIKAKSPGRSTRGFYL